MTVKTQQPELQGASGITVAKPDQEDLVAENVTSWPIWEKDRSTFEWHFGEQETCFCLDGEATVRTIDGEITIGKGDLVTFPAGCECQFRVKKPISARLRVG